MSEPITDPPPSPLALASHIALTGAALIRATLTLTHGNIRRAASLLSLSPSALHRRIAASAELAAFARTFPLSTRQPPTHAKRQR